jgi:LPS sulfotransferase NodH
MAEVGRFIILATQRTGSSWVQEMLDSHPRVRVFNELFLSGARGKPIWGPDNVEFAESFLDARRRRPSPLTRLYWQYRYLQRVFGQSDVDAVGFKYMYDQVPHSLAVLPHAALSRVRVIHVVRRNLLDRIISNKLAQKTGLFHLAGDDRPPVPWWPNERVESTVRLPVDELLDELRQLTRQRALMRSWLRLSRTPVREVEYEALVEDHSGFGLLLRFLGLPQGDWPLLSSGLQKLRTRSQAEVIENFAEIRAALAPTPYAAYLQP